MLKAAIKEHENNHNVYKDMQGITFREDRTVRGFGFADVCPFGFVRELEASKIPIYSYSGWFDGAYPNSAINRFLSVRNPGSRLIIGPWDHGGKRNISPFSTGPYPAFSHQKELLRFFDLYLKGVSTGIEKENPVWYFTMGEEKWKSSPVWPPPGGKKIEVFLGEKNSLTYSPPTIETASDTYKVNYDAGTGERSRWNSLYNPHQLVIGYPNRRWEDKNLLVYDSPPLLTDVTVTGNPIAKIYFAASAKDAELFVYLEDVSPDGSVQYVTEGELRAMHRKESVEAPLYKSMGVNRTYSEEDAASLTPGKVVEMKFELIATSYQFKKDHRIRIAIAGADKDHFVILAQDPPLYRLERSSRYPSRVELPTYGLE
jgi:putative CocE/NonD family hydrolase